VVAISWVAVTVVSGLPYSYQQLEHATTVIGAPPGFSAALGEGFYQCGAAARESTVASSRDSQASTCVAAHEVAGGIA
jgi:hypothetical protein